jgi:hypothetical protein
VDVTSTGVEQWTDPSTRDRGHPDEPVQPCATSDTQQQRLGLVVRMVAVEDETQTSSVGLGLERGVTHVSGVGLDTGTTAYDLHGQDHMLDIEQVGERCDLRRVTVVDAVRSESVRHVAEDHPHVGACAGYEQCERGRVRTS